MDMIKHAQDVKAFIRQLGCANDIVDDIAQETFLRAERGKTQFRGDANMKSWLCKIALNLARDHFRREARSPETTGDEDHFETAPASDATAEEKLLEVEMTSCIREFLARLPAPQYNVVALFDLGGFTHDEVAQELGISVNNSRVLLHRGRERLRKAMAEGCDLSFDSDAIPCQRRHPS